MYIIECTVDGFSGSVSLPPHTEFEDKHFQYFFDTSEKYNLEDGEDEDVVGLGYKIRRRSALIAIEFIEAFGEWEINELPVAKYKASMPVLLTYWLATEFTEYMRPFLAPNTKRNNSGPPSSNPDKGFLKD